MEDQMDKHFAAGRRGWAVLKGKAGRKEAAPVF